MKKKKHRQHKDVYLGSRGGIRIGGVVVPYWPAYWGGPSHSEQGAHNGNRDETSGNSAGDGSGGADSSGQM